MRSTTKAIESVSLLGAMKDPMNAVSGFCAILLFLLSAPDKNAACLYIFL